MKAYDVVDWWENKNFSLIFFILVVSFFSEHMMCLVD